MAVETFSCKLIEVREASVRVLHNGREAFVPRSQIERMRVQGDSAEIAIPYWLYKKKFEDPAEEA